MIALLVVGWLMAGAGAVLFVYGLYGSVRAWRMRRLVRRPGYVIGERRVGPDGMERLP